MNKTNTRVITAKAAYNTIIEESYHVAKWKFDLAERAIYFKLMKNINSNTYYKINLGSRNGETFDEIWDYLDTVWAEAEIAED